MFNEAIHHVDQTWNHIWQDHSTTVEKLEFSVEFAAAAVGVGALTKFGLSRCFASAETTAKLEAVLPKLELEGSSALPTVAKESSPGAMLVKQAVGAEAGDVQTIASNIAGAARPRIKIGETRVLDCPSPYREIDPSDTSFLRSLERLKISQPFSDQRPPTYLVTAGDPGKWFTATYAEDKSVQVSFTGRRLAALADGSASLGAEERILLQHFGGPGNPQLNEGFATEADKIITCYPEKLPLWARIKHVLPDHEGPVWLRINDLGIESDGRAHFDHWLPPIKKDVTVVARSLLVEARPTK